MPSITKILHPTDFSASSASAAAYACFLAEKFDAALEVLFVLEGSMDKIPDSDVGFPPPGESCVYSSVAGPNLKEVVGVDPQQVRRVTLVTRVGPISDQAVAHALASHCDLIVMGTHGRRGFAYAVAGSVAEAVVRKAPCPVLTVGKQAAAQEQIAAQE
jgi:universal stress protein A